MSEFTVAVAQAGKTQAFGGGNEVELLESRAIVTVGSSRQVHLQLDDEPLPCFWHQDRSISIAELDLTNQVGFHRLSVWSGDAVSTYDFRTSTAKATWDEIKAMADVCAGHYFAYRKQFSYVARTGELRKVILPQIQFGWLRDRIEELDRLVKDISARPALEIESALETSTRGRLVSVPDTIKLIHERPELLEPGEGGPIQVDGQSYWPAMVRARATFEAPCQLEHAQIAYFIRALLGATDFLLSQVEPALANTVRQWQVRLRSMLSREVFRQLGTAPEKRASLSAVPTSVQRRDLRYKRLRALQAEYFSDIGTTDHPRDSIRANLRDVWDIYQAFVAHVIGHSYGLEYASRDRDLRKRDADGAAMFLGDMRLYYDQKPPKKYLSSWRDGSTRPAGERPDVVVLDTKAKVSLVLDAKFRVDQDGQRAKAEDLFEMQGYLNSFDVKAGGIVFPGSTASAREVRGDSQAIVELPLRADLFQSLGSPEKVHEYVRLALLKAWTPLPAST